MGSLAGGCGRRGEVGRLFTAADCLQSLAHQLASDQSMPLIIANHSGTGAPTLPSTASVQLRCQAAVNRVTARNDTQLATLQLQTAELLLTDLDA